jgi:hypothetical protein
MSLNAPWTIETETETVTADLLDGQLYETSPGSDITASFAFVSWGDGDPRNRHGQLQAFVDAAVDGTTIRTGRTSTGRPYYREELSGYGEVGSLLVALVPASGNRGGVWAVLRGGTDQTPSVEEDVFVWQLDVTVLERYDGEDRATIEDAYNDEVL